MSDDNLRCGIVRTSIEAAFAFGLAMGSCGSLTLDQAACIYSGLMAGDWTVEEVKRRHYFIKRATDILERASRRNPIYDEMTVEGIIWRCTETDTLD